MMLERSESQKDDVFYVLDFDRTLGNTDKFHEVLEEIVENETGVTADELKIARAQIEGTGRTFDTVDYVRGILEQSGNTIPWHVLQNQFIAVARKRDMLEPHAAELLTMLDDKQLPYGIITYGNETWQLAKLEAANLFDIPHIVTHIEEKSQLLQGWKHTSDTFIIPPALTRDFLPLQVHHLVFLDDKAKSFAGIPSGVHGVHIKAPSGIVLPIQQGSLPSGVDSVIGIEGAIELLFGKQQTHVIDKT